MNEERDAEKLMSMYEELKKCGYLIETRDRSSIVVMRDWRTIGYTHSFEMAVRIAYQDMIESRKAEHGEEES